MTFTIQKIYAPKPNKQLRPMLRFFRSPARSVSHAQALAAERYGRFFMKQNIVKSIIALIFLFALSSCKCRYYDIIPHPYSCDTIKQEWEKSRQIGNAFFEIKYLQIRLLEYKIAFVGRVVDKVSQQPISGVTIFVFKGDTCKCQLIGPVVSTDKWGRFKYKVDQGNFVRLLLTYPGMESQEIKIKNRP
jgi:hypothetical protein